MNPVPGGDPSGSAPPDTRVFQIGNRALMRSAALLSGVSLLAGALIPLIPVAAQHQLVLLVVGVGVAVVGASVALTMALRSALHIRVSEQDLAVSNGLRIHVMRFAGVRSVTTR